MTQTLTQSKFSIYCKALNTDSGCTAETGKLWHRHEAEVNSGMSYDDFALCTTTWSLQYTVHFS